MSKNHSASTKEPTGAGNFHDRCARHFMRNVAIASDLLRFYVDTDSGIAKLIDVDTLQPAPTHEIGKNLKELVKDVSFLARLKDAAARSEVLFTLEHKSRPSPMVALQVGTQALLTLYSSWTNAGYTDSKNFELPIPIMIVLYHGTEDWVENEIQFQDSFKNIPPEFRRLVPQFTVLVINLRRFQYGNLPGQPVTRAFVESLMRATDGTFARNLDSVLRHVREADLDKVHTWDMIETISTYCAWADELTEERFKQAILTVFSGPEGIEMSETIPKGMLRDGFLRGEAEGRARGRAQGRAEGKAEGVVEGKIEAILTFLHTKFNHVPDDMKESLYRMTDPIALESLIALVAACDTLDEFAEALK